MYVQLDGVSNPSLASQTLSEEKRDKESGLFSGSMRGATPTFSISDVRVCMADSSDSGGCLLGIDIGTSNVKVVLIEGSSLSVLHKDSKPLGELEGVDIPNAAERSVSQIFHALECCMRSLEDSTHLLGRVKGIGVCGQMHGCVLWNSDGEPLFNETIGELQPTCSNTSNLITWQDGRCTPSFLSTLPQTQPPVSAGYGCATLAWLQHYDSKSLSGYDRAGTVMDLVVCALCNGGSGDVIMSSQNATGWGYFNTSTIQWSKEILEGVVPLHLLPRVVNVPCVAGLLVSDWHQIPRGTKVSVAMGDMQCSVYAAQPNISDVVLNMGSASQLVLIKPSRSIATPTTELPLPDSVAEVPYFGGDHLLVAAALGGGNTVSAFVTTLQEWLRDLGLDTGHLHFEDVYKKVMQLAMEKLDTTLQVDPRLWGERHAPELRGRVWDVEPDNVSLGDIGSAIVRGMVQNLHTMMSPNLLHHYKVKRVLGSGQTLQKYEVFREHIQRVFKLPLVLKEEVDAPLGAAMAAACL